MPILSAEPVEANIYRVNILICNGMTDNIVVTPDGLYSVYYIKDGKSLNRSGRILNVVQNRACPDQSYILFDWSMDNASRRERIKFFQVQALKDITPNDAYQIALKHGFVGTEDDWLESLHGENGKNAYDLAVDCGFEGTLDEWIASLKGKDAYELAVENGFQGTIDDWFAQNGDVTVLMQRISVMENHMTWVEGMEHPAELGA